MLKIPSWKKQNKYQTAQYLSFQIEIKFYSMSTRKYYLIEKPFNKNSSLKLPPSCWVFLKMKNITQRPKSFYSLLEE